jgi:serine protease
MKVRTLFALIVLIAIALGFSFVGTGAIAVEATQPNLTIDADLPVLYPVTGMVSNQVIIEFNSYAEARAAQSVDTLPGVAFDRAMTSRPVARYNIIDGRTPFEAITSLRNFSNIREVYPNYKRSASVIPNDPYYELQKEELQVSQVPAAWDIETGNGSVLVGVIDTGVQTDHPDLVGNLVLPGINVREGPEWPNVVQDDSGHGTVVSGIIGAVGNNGIGVAGINWNVKILPIRACGGPALDCDLFDEVEGIDTARENNCDVINLSIGGIGTISIEEKAVTDAHNAGCVIVAAAGNANPGRLYEATGDPAIDRPSLYYPAALPEVIGVGAITNDGQKATFSNYGEAILSIMAPGVDIVSTVPDYECYLYDGTGPPYGLASGTSFSTPMVAGVAALILSHFPGLSPDDVRARLEATAIPMAGPDNNGNGVNDYYGYGILNAAGALSQSGSSANSYMQVGVSSSPIFAGEIIVLVKAFVALDYAPNVNWSVRDSDSGGIFQLEPVANRPGFYIGRFNPGQPGNISVTVSGISNGTPLAPVTVLYVLSD